MRRNHVLFTLLLFCSCTLLKRTSKTTDESFNKLQTRSDFEAVTIINRLKSDQHLVLRRDSLEATYKLHLWPKGTINFAPGGGFTGEFDSILMVGKQNQQVSSAKLLNTNALETTKSNVNSRQEERLDSGKKEVQKVKLPDVKVIVVFIVVVGLVIFFIIRKVIYLKK